jgi:hypothetical protein
MLFYTIVHYTITIIYNIVAVLRLLVTAKIIPTAPILVNLTMEAIRSSETSVLS